MCLIISIHCRLLTPLKRFYTVQTRLNRKTFIMWYGQRDIGRPANIIWLKYLKKEEREEGEDEQEFGLVLCLIRSFARFLVLPLSANTSSPHRYLLNIFVDIKIVLHREPTVPLIKTKIGVSENTSAYNWIVITIKSAKLHCRQHRIKLILINPLFVYCVKSGGNSRAAKILPTMK